MNNRVIHFLGIFIVFIGACMLLPLIIALAYGELHEAGAFLISAIICMVPGLFVRLTSKTSLVKEKLKLRDSYFLVAACWIFASIFGAIPYLITSSTENALLAFFETASGFTTTGASIFNDVEILPKSILVWRSFTQWLGGMGMIVLFFALLPKFGVSAHNISKVETPGPIQRKMTSRFSSTARRLYISYILLSGALLVLLIFGGMTPFDALNHSFTTMATGGFSTHNEGLAYFNNNYIYWIIAIFAFLAGSNFTLFFDLIEGKIKQVLADEEYRRYIIIIFSTSILIAISLCLSNLQMPIGESISSSFFQVVNTISTLGFASGNTTWPSFAIMILVCLMIMGGCSSSTAGGVKVSRVVTLAKVVRREIRMRVHESVVEDVRYNGEKLNKETMDYILSFVVLYLTVVASGTLLVCFFGGGEVMTNLLTILSCISNLGPGLDNLGLLCNYHTDSIICVITYCFVMIAGRLEITSFLVLFSRHFWNPDKI